MDTNTLVVASIMISIGALVVIIIKDLVILRDMDGILNYLTNTTVVFLTSMAAIFFFDETSDDVIQTGTVPF